MPRPRKPENAGLPKRWRFDHGAYYYQVPPGQEHQWEGKKTFRLGRTQAEAYRKWAEIVEYSENVQTIGQLLDRYSLEVIPHKQITTQNHNRIAIKPIKAVFSSMPLREIKPRHIYQYIDKREAKTSAKREIEILSHAFTKAVEWGYLDRHPFKGEVRLKGEKPRTRYVEDWEIVECLGLSSKRNLGSIKAVHAYIRIKLLTGMRRGDLLRLTVHQLKEDGVHITPHKTLNSTGKQLIFEWTTELRQAIDEALAARPCPTSQFVFCNRVGSGYFNEENGRAGGWESMWRGFITRVLKETQVKIPFTEHDLRAKCASDAPSLEHAKALLSHADSKITDRVYRRKPERVMPVKTTFNSAT